jgi:zinc/manganese transport system substrate-binding protein
MIKNILLSIIALALMVPMARAKLNVVATTADLGSLAKEIGGDHIELVVLAKPTEDPRSVDAKPSSIEDLKHADVLVEGGAGLELRWLPALLDQAQNTKIVAGAPGHISCVVGVTLMDTDNPHYVIAPSNGKIIAKNIAEGLAANDPKSAGFYLANLKKFDDTIDAKLVEWHKKLDPFKGRSVAAYHNSWPYFAKEFGLRMDLFLESKPGIPPTSAQLADLAAKMKEERASAIVIEPYFNRETAETVARETNAWVVDVTQFPGGLEGTEGGYIQLVDVLVNKLAQALTGFT